MVVADLTMMPDGQNRRPPGSLVGSLMNPALRLVSDRLPQVQESARELYERDEVFREMCDEYQLCHETQARMVGAVGRAAAVREEYVALGLRLEAEMLRYLAEHAEL